MSDGKAADSNMRGIVLYQADIIDSLTAEVEKLRSVTDLQETFIRKAEAENEKLRAALDEAQQAFALERYNAERLQTALSPFASTKADDGYDYISGLPDMVIIRIEASVREIKAARAALEEK